MFEWCTCQRVDIFCLFLNKVHKHKTAARFTFEYNAYDAAGNLTSKMVTVANGVTPIVTYTDTYTYGDTNWKDLLTAFNGNSITYDAIGNPTKYYDGSTMKWTEGRRLQSITKNGQTTSYQYDANGNRTQVTYPDGSYTKFCILDGRVIGEIVYKRTSSGVKWSHGVRYIYGDDGSMVGFGIWDADTVNEWERYYFVKNLQGDVRKVYREADNKLVASFDYDPFGKVISATGDMADQIPFRYRGYYYDTETGFYYLQSRYYDPQTCRFINADAYVSTGQDFVGYNMFSYCNNNPVSQADYTGEFGLLTLAAAAVSAVVNVTTTYIAAKVTGQEYTFTDALVSAAIGAANLLPGGPFIAGAISGIYSATTVLNNGATLGEAMFCFGVSAVMTTASIGNIAQLGAGSLSSIAANASADLVFGTGYNCVSAATNKTVMINAEERRTLRIQVSSPTHSYSVQKERSKRMRDMLYVH